MSSGQSDHANNPFDPTEPRRDEALGALLRRAEGDVPVSAVDWDRLAARIASALPSRMSTSWWSYTARWERRVLPLALAASLAGAFALWSSAEPSAAAVTRADASEIIAEVVQGAPADDAARSFARSVTSDATSDVALGESVPE